MSASSGFRVPKYCHHRASNRARVRVNGKYQFLPGPFESRESRAAYQQILDQLAQDFTKERHRLIDEPLRGDCLVAELLVRYLRHADSYYPNSNRPDVIRLSIRPLKLLYSGCQVDKIGPPQWEQVRQWFIDNGQSRSGVNGCMCDLLGIVKWGLAQQLVSPDTYHTLKAIAPLKIGRCDVRESPKRTAVNLEHVNAIERVVSKTIWAMIQVQLLTGARPGEICCMTAGDIDRTDSIWVYRPKSHKNAWREKDRVIYIGPRARAILLPRLPTNPNSPIFAPEQLRKHDSYDSRSYRLAVKRACRKAGIPTWTPYQLRHAAGQQTRAEHGIEGVSARLGNTVTAAQVYAENNQRLGRELAAKCG